MEARETLEDGCGPSRNCANSQSANQSGQDAITEHIKLPAKLLDYILRSNNSNINRSAGCRLCRIAREARGDSIDGLAAETHCHINSAGCEGMSTTVTAAYDSIWRHLYDSMHAAQKPKSNLKFITLDKEHNMSTLWRVTGDEKSF